MSPFWMAVLLTSFAGLSTGIGGLIALFSKKINKTFLAVSLGFSAGVMIYVSMIELFPEAKKFLSSYYGDKKGYLICTLAFFTGIAIIAIIDKLIPKDENPHEGGFESSSESDFKLRQEYAEKDLLRTGLFSALAISIHNFPEGLATFASIIQDPKLGITIAIAIAIHNIPEGISVAVPIYFSTKNKKRAFLISLLSGLAEPIGGIFGYLLLRSFFNDASFGIIFAVVAGIMVYISLDELLPAAEKSADHHYVIVGVIAGMIVMAFSLVALA